MSKQLEQSIALPSYDGSSEHVIRTLKHVIRTLEHAIRTIFQYHYHGNV